MSKKKEVMRGKLNEFANMVEKGNVFDEFDDYVFESGIYKLIIGRVDSNENMIKSL